MTTNVIAEVKWLVDRNQQLQDQWDHFQRLCRDHGAHGIGDMIVQRDALVEQVEALAKELDAERDNCVNIIAAYQEERSALVRAVDTDYEQLYREEVTKLAAAQAQIAQLRGALETISDEENWGEDGCWESSSYPDEIAMEALALPTDTAALDARLAQERERCAIECEKKAIGFDRQDFMQCAASIREMK